MRKRSNYVYSSKWEHSGRDWECQWNGIGNRMEWRAGKDTEEWLSATYCATRLAQQRQKQKQNAHSTAAQSAISCRRSRIAKGIEFIHTYMQVYIGKSLRESEPGALLKVLEALCGHNPRILRIYLSAFCSQSRWRDGTAAKRVPTAMQMMGSDFLTATARATWPRSGCR